MHKVFRINKYFCLGLTTIAVLGTQIVKANDEMFQNNLLKMDVRKTPLGGVKVMLYTTKPYKDAVVVNKKSDNEYVILMPETASTMTSKPALNATADVLTKIDVKTQQYGAAQGQKGYTKIIISTLKPIEITPQIETLGVAQYKLSEKETKELLEQAGKKHVSVPAQQSQKIVAKAPTTQTVKTQKTTVAPALKTTKKVAEKDTKTVTKAIAQKPLSTEQTLTKPNPQKQTATKKPQETVKVAETKPTETVQNKELTKPAEVKLEPQVKEEPTIVQEQTQTATAPVTTEKQSKAQAILAILNNNSTMILAGLVPAIIILLLLMLIKRTKKNNTQKGFMKAEKAASAKGESLNQEDNSSTNDYINDDMDWKEKFKTYKSQPNITATEEASTEELPTDEMFFEETLEEIPIQYGMEEEEEEALELEELFSQQNQAKPNSPQEDEGNLEDASSDIQDNQDDAIWDEFVGPEPSTEASIEDLFSEDDIIEDLEQGLDESFIESKIETAPSAEYKEDSGELEDVTDIYETYQCTEECANSIASLNPPAEPYFEDHRFTQSPIEKTTEEVAEAEEEDDETQLSTKSSFQIDETKGFYLINFEGATALVGYINEEIFILKRFDGAVQGVLKARLNEHTGNAATYMVRVGNFKAIIEVTPQKMNFVLEL